jgi:O-methyltransferase
VPTPLSSSIAVGDRWLDLLVGCLTRELFLDEEAADVRLGEWPGGPDEVGAVRDVLRERGWRLVRRGGDAEARAEGRDWPPYAETMVGRARLDHVRRCAAEVLADGVPGDFAECGVWRGGVVTLLRAALAVAGDDERLVWAADSFEGLPAPDPGTPQDAGADLSGVPILAVGADQVRANLARYGLLDDRVRFLVGWFSDTLPTAPIERLSLLRVDGDLYRSTMDVLTSLEPKVSEGGWVIVDDYGSWEPCRLAVDEYRATNGITAEIEIVDWTGIAWRKGS